MFQADTHVANIKNQSIISKETQGSVNVNADSTENANYSKVMITVNDGKEELHVADDSVCISALPLGDLHKPRDNITKNEYDVYISYSPDDIEFVLSLGGKQKGNSVVTYCLLHSRI